MLTKNVYNFGSFSQLVTLFAKLRVNQSLFALMPTRDAVVLSKMKMHPNALLQHFVSFIPEFAERWNSEHNYNRHNDATIALHGLCSEFSYCFRDHYTDLSDDVYKCLFEFIELHLVEPSDPETMLDNALCTCFLENISSEPCGQAARQWMGRKSRAYFDQWHIGPPYD